MNKSKNGRYPAEVFWSDEDDGYIAIAPDLPGCSAWGSTQGKALRELDDAIEAWTTAALAAGNPVPEPSPRSAPAQYSGRFVVRVPRQLHADLARQAQRENTSLNQYVVYLLSAATANKPPAALTTGTILFASNVSTAAILDRVIELQPTSFVTDFLPNILPCQICKTALTNEAPWGAIGTWRPYMVRDEETNVDEVEAH